VVDLLVTESASEALMVRRAAAGDDIAFAGLVRRHERAARRLATRMVGPAAAEDVLQDALLRAWRGLPAFAGDAAFGTWLHRIVANLCLDHRRRVARQPASLPREADSIPAVDADPADRVALAELTAERREVLHWALEQLPDEERRLVELRAVAARSYQEIAGDMGVSSVTVGTRLFRTRARLRRLIASRLAIAVAAALLVLSALAQPEAWASVGLFLRQVVLRETTPPSEPTALLPLERVTLAEARRRVDWTIREPSWLPEGYQLENVYVGQIHEAARGSTVVLDYRRGRSRLEIVELRAAARVAEDVAPGAARSRQIGDSTVLAIDGRWAARDGGRTWVRGDTVRAIVERGDVVIQLQADPREGLDVYLLPELAAAMR
jgi:RNA polymerase sigma-70 factor (ECF subfamily)